MLDQNINAAAPLPLSTRSSLPCPRATCVARNVSTAAVGHMPSATASFDGGGEEKKNFCGGGYGSCCIPSCPRGIHAGLFENSYAQIEYSYGLPNFLFVRVY